MEPRALGRGRHREYATPCAQRLIKAAVPPKIGHCSAIESKIDNQISRQARRPQNDETPARLSGSSSNRNRVDENQNQEEPTWESVFWFHDPKLRSGPVLGECSGNRRPDSLSPLPRCAAPGERLKILNCLIIGRVNKRRSLGHFYLFNPSHRLYRPNEIKLSDGCPEGGQMQAEGCRCSDTSDT